MLAGVDISLISCSGSFPNGSLKTTISPHFASCSLDRAFNRASGDEQGQFSIFRLNSDEDLSLESLQSHSHCLYLSVYGQTNQEIYRGYLPNVSFERLDEADRIYPFKPLVSGEFLFELWHARGVGTLAERQIRLKIKIYRFIAPVLGQSSGELKQYRRISVLGRIITSQIYVPPTVTSPPNVEPVDWASESTSVRSSEPSSDLAQDSESFRSHEAPNNYSIDDCLDSSDEEDSELPQIGQEPSVAPTEIIRGNFPSSHKRRGKSAKKYHYYQFTRVPRPSHYAMDTVASKNSIHSYAQRDNHAEDIKYLRDYSRNANIDIRGGAIAANGPVSLVKKRTSEKPKPKPSASKAPAIAPSLTSALVSVLVPAPVPAPVVVEQQVIGDETPTESEKAPRFSRVAIVDSKKA